MRRNVLQFVCSFFRGGSERMGVQLARLLHEGGRYRVHVACLDAGGPLSAEVGCLGLGEIPEFRLTSFYDRNALAQLRRCARLLREWEIDVVQTHDFYSNVFGMAAAWLAGVPVRVASRRETVGTRGPLPKAAERGAYRLAHAVVANAEAVRRQLIREGVRAGKIEVIRNGLDPGRVAPRPGLGREAMLAELELPRGGRRFVTIVANLMLEVKDHGTFLRAARRVRDAVPEAAFVLVGGGDLTDSVRAAAARLGLGGDVFFLGNRERVAEVLALSEVCVLSSKAEGFPNAILEYMAAARPVVATDVGGAREAVVDGETGHLVRVGDDRAMAERIISLLRDPGRAGAMGARGRRAVTDKFSCEAQLERTQELYDRLLARYAGRLPGRPRAGAAGVQEG